MYPKICQYRGLTGLCVAGRARRVGMQSAKLFLQSLELELPQPLTRRRLGPPPPWFRGGRGTLAGKREDGRVPIPTR